MLQKHHLCLHHEFIVSTGNVSKKENVSRSLEIVYTDKNYYTKQKLRKKNNLARCLRPDSTIDGANFKQ